MMKVFYNAKSLFTLLVIVGFGVLGCTEQLMTPNISSYGGKLDSIVSLITLIVVPFACVSIGLILYFIIRYKKSDGGEASYVKHGGMDDESQQVNANSVDSKLVKLGIGKKVFFGKKIHLGRHVAFILLYLDIIVFLLDIVIIYRNIGPWTEIEGNITKAKDAWVLPAGGGETIASKDVLEIKAVLRQFEFDFYYPGRDGILNTKDDFKISHYMHVPVDKKVVVHIAAPINDVIHNLFIKAIRLKQDAIPGRTISRWFQIDKEKVDSIGQVDWDKQILFSKKERKEYFKLERSTVASRKLLAIVPMDKRPPIKSKIDSQREKIKKFYEENQLEKRLHVIACAELCGPDHSVMNAWMIVDSKKQFEEWYQMHLK